MAKKAKKEVKKSFIDKNYSQISRVAKVAATAAATAAAAAVIKTILKSLEKDNKTVRGKKTVSKRDPASRKKRI